MFKTTDGGHTWEKILYIDESTGIIDIAINLKDPDILYASAYYMKRRPWTFEPGGERSRLYKSEEGGESWGMISVGGFPDGSLGSNHLKTPKEENGLELWYYFKNDEWGKAKLTVTDMYGAEVYTRDIDAEKGMKRVYWNTYSTEPGIYNVSLTYKGRTITKKGEVRERWIWPVLNYRR